MALRFIEAVTYSTGFHELSVALIVCFASTVGLLIGLTCVDCLIVGIRARDQFLFGSLFGSDLHDKKMTELLSMIEDQQHIKH